uniref:Uncharacterized protein n=1 Tax=Rhizophora mucronata TaxID=61149 RepID=A0A2P2L2D1_RHIMU
MRTSPIASLRLLLPLLRFCSLFLISIFDRPRLCSSAYLLDSYLFLLDLDSLKLYFSYLVLCFIFLFFEYFGCAEWNN